MKNQSVEAGSEGADGRPCGLWTGPLEEVAVARVALAMRDWDRREIFATRWSYDPLRLAAQVLHYSTAGLVAGPDPDHPVAVVSIVEAWPGTAQVAMFATPDWPWIARPLTRHLLRRLRPQLLAAGLHRAECRSLDGHREAQRWLRALGFVREATLPDYGSGRETFHLYAWRLCDVHVQRSQAGTAGTPAAAPGA